MRIVLDANVLAPGFLNPASVAGRLLDLWHRKRYELVMSKHLLGELVGAYADPYFEYA